MKIKLQLPDIFVLITLASTTLYIIARNLPFGMGSFAFLWAPLCLLLLTAIRPKTFSNGPIRILLLYGVISVGILQNFLWKYMDEWNQIRILYEFYYLVILCVIFFYYYGKGDFRMFAFLSKWTFIFIVISLITTNIALFFDPNVVRESARTGMFTPLQEKIYNLSGAMSYSYLQSVVCLIPILIYYIKENRSLVFSPKMLIAILFLLIITQIRAQVFANILVTVFITLFSILGSKRYLTSIVTISLVGILIISIPSSFYTDLLFSSSSYFSPESEMHYKLTDFAEFIDNPEFDASTGAGGRAERYPLLFEALRANLLLGSASIESSGNIEPGAHLYWMNRLTLWGVPGFLFFIFVLYRIFRSISSLFNNGYRFYYLLSIAAFFFLGLTKAIGGRESWLILIIVIPGFYYLPFIQKKNKTI